MGTVIIVVKDVDIISCDPLTSSLILFLPLCTRLTLDHRRREIRYPHVCIFSLDQVPAVPGSGMYHDMTIGIVWSSTAVDSGYGEVKTSCSRECLESEVRFSARRKISAETGSKSPKTSNLIQG